MSVANRAAISRALDFSRFSSSFLRSFSTSSPSTSSSNPNASAASSKNKRRKKKKNLFEVVQFLPNWGVGYHVAKAHWDEISYQITKINLYKVCLHLVLFLRLGWWFVWDSSPSIICRKFGNKWYAVSAGGYHFSSAFVWINWLRGFKGFVSGKNSVGFRNFSNRIRRFIEF